MLYRQRFDTFIRQYDDIGYVRNAVTLRDLVVDAVGTVFLNALSRSPSSLDEIVAEVSSAFTSPPECLADDVREFYAILEQDGFIVSGESPQELDDKDVRFTYATAVLPSEANRESAKILRTEQDSQSYLSRHFRDRPRLVSLHIELTSQCNERCIHCYIPVQKRARGIEASLYYDVLAQAKEMGLLSLTLSGGEPFLHKEFPAFLRRALECDFSVSILSNLTLLNDEILSIMKQGHIQTVGVSLYSLEPKVHDAITLRRGSHANTMSAIERLMENDIPVQINTPVMKQNQATLPAMIAWATANKLNIMSDYAIVARYDSSDDNLAHRLSVDEVEPLIWSILENDPGYQSQLLGADFDKLMATDRREDPMCGVCTSSISMVASGVLYPCAGWQSRALGDVRTQSLKDIWENSPEVKFLRGVRRKDFPECLDCEDRAFCAVCMVRNANESPTNDPLEINRHFCGIAAANRRVVDDWLSTRPAAYVPLGVLESSLHRRRPESTGLGAG